MISIKKRARAALLVAIAAMSSSQASPIGEPTLCAVYEGIDGYGIDDPADNKADFRFRFYTDQGVRSFAIGTDDGLYTMQNRLQEGYRFVLTLSADSSRVVDIEMLTPIAEGTITDFTPLYMEIEGQRLDLGAEARFANIEMKAGGSIVRPLDALNIGDRVKVYGSDPMHVDRTFVAEPYAALVYGVPGDRTVLNFLCNALTPVGTTLYVFGGAWNWQDTGSGQHARHIGLPEDWVSFFQMNDAAYEYKNPDPSKSYYPFQGYDEYHYAGADCSGFVGWTIYNTLQVTDGAPGYVMPSTRMAQTLAHDYGLGIYSRESDPSKFLPGDIISIKGHVYIVVGRAEDGSLLIVHSTVNDGQGSGVQLSAVGKYGEASKAQDLAQRYMALYPAWSERYQPAVKPQGTYLDFKAGHTGRFSWTIGPNGLSDPQGIRSMSAEQILELIYGQ